MTPSRILLSLPAVRQDEDSRITEDDATPSPTQLDEFSRTNVDLSDEISANIHNGSPNSRGPGESMRARSRTSTRDYINTQHQFRVIPEPPWSVGDLPASLAGSDTSTSPGAAIVSAIAKIYVDQTR
jgi:hypothetical protein